MYVWLLMISSTKWTVGGTSKFLPEKVLYIPSAIP